MIPILSYKPSDKKELLKRLEQKTKHDRNIQNQVLNIIAGVQKDGDKALLEYTKNFDGLGMQAQQIAVSQSEIINSEQIVSDEFKKAVHIAYTNIEAFHKHQVAFDVLHQGRYGEKLALRSNALEKVGLYIPGGKAGETPLFSSLLMAAIPARLAGVKSIIVCSPPRSDLSLSPELLYIAKCLKISAIFKLGGAQAIAAMAYGTETLPSVDIIAGPGNDYVNYCKKQVFGDVMIDSLAGPSEIAIIANHQAKAEHIVLDLFSQAEHGGHEMAILLSDNKKLIEDTAKLMQEKIHSYKRHKLIRSSLEKRGALILVQDLNEAIDFVNDLAPEHLEILCGQESNELSKKIKNAGAIFIGEYSCEPIGDYIAGTNHILPTAGSARFSSSLSVHTFRRYTNLIQYTKEALAQYGAAAAVLANLEGLEAHARSITQR